MEHELDSMTASCDKARRSAHRDRVLLSEARIQSSELQVEMREDVEALELRLKETGEQLCEVKTRLVHVKEATAASKAKVVPKSFRPPSKKRPSRSKSRVFT